MPGNRIISVTSYLLPLMLFCAAFTAGYSFAAQSTVTQHPSAIEDNARSDNGHPSSTATPQSTDCTSSLSSDREGIADSRRNAIVIAAEKVGPAVVSINVIQTRVVRQQSHFSPFSDDLFDSFWREFFPPRMYRRQIQSLGSGVIIDGRGYIVTNEHVTRGADTIKITLTDGREFDAELIGEDPGSDIALLKIDENNLPYVELGDSDRCIIGEWVIAIGNPFGYLLEDHQPTVTVGVISALNRDFKPESETGKIYMDMIQTDASINPGNSGGALVNSKGHLVGINTFIFTESGGSLGIGFAIPINRVRKIIRDILEFGKPMDVWIGVMVQEITPSLATFMGLSGTEGVLVSDIAKGVSITQGDISLETGDVIISLNGKKIHNMGDWEKYLSQLSRGEEVELVARRGSEEFTFDAKAIVPPVQRMGKWIPLLNVKVSDITNDIQTRYRFKSHTGVVITEARRNASIITAGMREGDVFKQVGNYRISNLRDFEYVCSMLEKGDAVLIVFERSGKYLYFTFTI
jgi:serine protease Do